MAFESMTNELANKSATGKLDMQSRIENSNNALKAWNSTVDTVNLGMETYAQNRWNKDEPDIKNDMYRLGDEYLDVNDEDSYNKYMDAVDNYINQKASGYGPLMKSYLLNHKTELVNYAKEKYQPRIDQQIAIANHNAFTEIEEKLVNKVSNNDWDFGSLGTPEMYKFSADSNGKIVRQKVEVEGLYEINDTMKEQERNWRSFLNAMLVAKCGDNCTMEEAKKYVQSKEDEWEYAVMSNDMVYLTKNAIDGKIDGVNIKNEQDLIKYLGTVYSKEGYRPYSGKKITPAEEEAFKKSATSIVATEWKAREQEAYAKYDAVVTPEILRREHPDPNDPNAQVDYVTEDEFDKLCEDAGIDLRFMTDEKTKLHTMFTINSVMDELEAWYNEGAPMGANLSSYCNNFIKYDPMTQTWAYTSGAGYVLSTGEYDRSLMLARNTSIDEANAEKGNQMMIGWEQNMNLLYDWISGMPKEGNPYQQAYNSEVERKEANGEKLSEADLEAMKLRMVYDQTNTLAIEKAKAMAYGPTNASEVSDRVKGYYELTKDIAETYDEAEKRALNLMFSMRGQNLYGDVKMYELSNATIGENIDTNEGINTAMAYTISNVEFKMKDAGFVVEDVYDNYLSDDPLGIGLDDDDRKHINEYAEKNNTDYYGAYVQVMCKDDKGNVDIDKAYKVMYKMLCAGVYALNDVDSEFQLLGIENYCKNEYAVGREFWRKTLQAEGEQLNNDIGVSNGDLVAVEGETNENGEKGPTIYVPTKPSLSSKGSSSSSSSKQSQSYDFDSLQKKAQEEIKEDTENEKTVVEPVPHVFESFLETLGTTDKNGHVITLSDLRTSSAYMLLLTDEEKKNVDWLDADEAGKKILGSFDPNSKIASAIDSASSNEFQKGRLWNLALRKIRAEYDLESDNREQVLSNTISEISTIGTKAFIDDMRAGNGKIDNLISKGEMSKTMKDDMIADGRDLMKGTKDNFAYYLGIPNDVEEYINLGINGTSQSGMPIFAQDGFSEMDSDQLLDACLVEAFKYYGHEGEYDGKKSFKQMIDDYNSKTGTNKGALDFFKIKQFASYLYEVSSIMKELEDPDLNLGKVVSVHGNEFTMERLKKPVIVKYNKYNRRQKYVQFMDGQTFEDVDTFMSKTTLENTGGAISNGINTNETFLTYKGAFLTGRAVKTVDFSEGESEPLIILRDTSDIRPEHNEYEEWGRMYEVGMNMSNNIDWSGFDKFDDGQVSQQFAELAGYTPPTLYSGYSLNGTDWNYVLTTNPNQTYTSNPPKTVMRKVGEAISGLARTEVEKMSVDMKNPLFNQFDWIARWAYNNHLISRDEYMMTQEFSDKVNKRDMGE